MTPTFRKHRTGAPPGFFACEAAGLGWLRVPGGPPVVEVLGVGHDHLDLVRLTAGPPPTSAGGWRCWHAGLFSGDRSQLRALVVAVLARA